MTEWLENVARGRRAAGGLLAFALASVVLFNLGPAATITESAGAPLLDVRFGWGAPEAHAFLLALGEEGRELYAIALVLDSLYALAFAAVAALALAWVLKTLAAPRARPLALAPVLAGGLDLVETAGVWTLLAAFPAEPRIVGDLAGVVTAAKLALVYAVMGLQGLGFIVVGARAIRRRFADDRRPEPSSP